MSKRRRFSEDQKAKIALEALRGGRTLQEIASKHQVHPNQVGAWKRQAVEGLGEVFSNGVERRRRDHESEVRELHAKIGELVVARVRSMSRAERRAVVVRDHPVLSLSRQCRLLSIGRSSLYYEPKGESAETLTLMRRVDELFLKYSFYGARQMVRHLRREGVHIGRRAPASRTPGAVSGLNLLRGLTIDAPTSPVSRCVAASFTWWRSWTGRAGMSWLGGCRTRWILASVSRRLRKPWTGMVR